MQSRFKTICSFGGQAMLVLVVFTLAGCGLALADTYREHMRSLLAERGGTRFRPDLELVVERLVVAYRKDQGAGGLRVALSLRAAARAQAMDLALHSMMGHLSSTGLGFDSRMRVVKGGAIFLPAMGENAARVRSGGPANASKAAKLVQQWIGSSGHRRNMVNRSYVAVATGVVQKGDQLYAVQIFTGPEVNTNLRRGASVPGFY